MFLITYFQKSYYMLYNFSEGYDSWFWKKFIGKMVGKGICMYTFQHNSTQAFVSYKFLQVSIEKLYK